MVLSPSWLDAGLASVWQILPRRAARQKRLAFEYCALFLKIKEAAGEYLPAAPVRFISPS